MRSVAKSQPGPPLPWQIGFFLSYVIPAVIGSYIIFAVMITVFVRRGVIQL